MLMHDEQKRNRKKQHQNNTSSRFWQKSFSIYWTHTHIAANHTKYSHRKQRHAIQSWIQWQQQQLKKKKSEKNEIYSKQWNDLNEQHLQQKRMKANFIARENHNSFEKVIWLLDQKYFPYFVLLANIIFVCFCSFFFVVFFIHFSRISPLVLLKMINYIAISFQWDS